jgi:hypothetical protein
MDSELTRAETPAIPPELVEPPPRRTQPTLNGIVLAAALVVIVAIAAVYTCFLITETSRQAEIRSALRGAGNETMGQIDRLRNPYHALKEYVDYTFVADGKNYPGEAIVPLEDWHTIQTTGGLSIRYLPQDPTMNHPVDWEWSAFLELDGYGVVLIIAGLGCIVFIAPQLCFEHKLAAEGIAAVGVVTKCSVSGRGGQFIALRYDFRTQDGISVEGRGRFLARREVGAKIVILYLPRDPRRSIPYPVSTWHIATR